MELDRMRYPLVIAHRGYSAAYPENTLTAFDQAAASGARMIELDVTLTRDRQIVVIHDETLNRTTNGRGRVADHTLAELKGLDAGGWFSERFAGEPIPTLAEALAVIGGRAAVNIEIKPEAYEAHLPADAIQRQVCRLLEGRPHPGGILISSFEFRVLADIARMGKPPAMGYLTDRAAHTGIFDACQKIGAFSWNSDHRYLNRASIEKAHGYGLRVFAYTVNSKREISRLMDMGVDGVFSDDPTAAEAVLAARQGF